MPSRVRVLLLHDQSWQPQVAGVCCWRRGVRAAFTAAGAEVEERSCRPVPLTSPGSRDRGRTGGVRAPRLAWLPPLVRTPLAAGHRSLRATASAVAHWWWRLPLSGQRWSLARRLAGARLVVAETPGVAAAATRAGAGRAELWVMVLSREPMFAGDTSGYAAQLARVSGTAGGFLVDSELTRESTERVAFRQRPRVVVYPPLAIDRQCPACGAPSEPPCGRREEASGGCSCSDIRASPPATVLARPCTAAGTVAAQHRAARAVLAAVAPVVTATSRPPRAVLVSGFDLKFATGLAGQLGRRTDLSVTVDEWPGLATPGPRTVRLSRRSDAILAEWARGSAVWLSRRKRPGQLLVVRLHRFELDTRHPRELAVEDVDAMVYIAPLFGRRIHHELGWPADKLVHIPNYVDTGWLDRSKLPGARFTLGMVGIETSRKRFDLALDLLAAVRRHDPRFRLVVRSQPPWRNRYTWEQPAQRRYVGQCFTRIEQDPLLRDAVRLDAPGRDMARWYRQVGYLLSTSDAEGSHLSVAEAMAAGTIPVIRAWPGAAEVYGPAWVPESLAGGVAAVLAGADPHVWQQRSDQARQEVRRSHDPAAVVAAWADLLHGDLAGARRHFPVSPTTGASMSSRSEPDRRGQAWEVPHRELVG